MLELLQAWVLERLIWRAILTEVSSLESTEAAHSSRHGMESCFKGAAFVFAVTRAIVGGPES